MKNTKKATAETTENLNNSTNSIVENVTEVVTETTETVTSATKSALGIITEAQTKLVESIVDNSKKLAETIGATATIEKTRNFVNEWLEKQQNNLENISETIKNQVQFEKAPELVKEVVEAQQQLGKEWFEALRTTLKAEDVNTLQEILVANVNKLQDNVKEVANFWKENLTQPTKLASIFSVDYAKDFTKKMVDMWTPASVK